MADPYIVRTLYRRLLALYPRAFREQLGESMVQTFSDLCHEQSQQSRRALFGFLVWLFLETAGGVVREHILRIQQGAMMKASATNFRLPALIGFLFVLPFMILELVNRRNFTKDFPFPLFFMLWLLPMLFIFTALPVMRNVRAGNSLLANPIGLLVRATFLTLIAIVWTGILLDQLPCFLGVPNCD